MDLLSDELKSLLTHDSFVRAIARRLVADSATADDVAQETWWAAVRRRPDSDRPLLPWLAKVARNFALKARRGDVRRHERELRAAAPEALPSTVSLVEREATRRRIVEAVFALPEPLRNMIVLRYFDGLPPRVIARRVGEPVETVKSRLKRALSILREKLGPPDPEERKAFGAALLALARGPNPSVIASAASGTAAVIGALVMTKGAKTVAALAAILLTVAGVSYMLDLTTESGETAAQRLADADRAHREAAQPQRSTGPRITSVPFGETAESASESAPAATTGSLLVKVRYADATPASGVAVTVGHIGYAWANGIVLEKTTDAAGAVLFEDLPTGTPNVGTDRGEGERGVLLKEGERTELTIALERGIEVDGVVQDEAGAPVAGADIILDQGVSHPGGRLVAKAAQDGTFRIRGVQFAMGIGARAAGYAPSPAHMLATSKNIREDARNLRLTLKRGGGTVFGRVVGPDERPVAGAMVLAGGEEHWRVTVPLEDGNFGFTPTAFLARSDADGRFRFPSLPDRLLLVSARAQGFAVWQGGVTPTAAGSQILIRLDRGVTLSGTVTDAEGRPVPQTTVRVGTPTKLSCSETQTGTDGSYRLQHLAAGELHVVAEGTGVFQGNGSRAETVLAASSGDSLQWNATLSHGLVIEGRVLDAKRQPRLSQVRCLSDDSQKWIGEQWTDKEGRFRFTNLEDLAHRVAVAWFGGLARGDLVVERGIYPGRGELVLVVPAGAEHPVGITGVVLDAAGKPLPGVEVSPWNLESLTGVIERSDASGRFSFSGLMPGRYRVDVHARGFPRATTAERALASGEVWNVGKIELQTGGRLEAKVGRADGGPVGRPPLTVRNVEGRNYEESLPFKDDVASSGLLLPGRYELRRGSAGTDPAPISFEIVAGETTKIEVALEPAVVRKLQIRDDGPQVSGLIHVVAKKFSGLCDEYITRQGSEPFECTLRLDPGSYDLEIQADSGRSVKTTIVVPDRNTPHATVPIVMK